MKTHALTLAMSAALLASGCGEGGPLGGETGDLAVSVAANEAVRDGFPHEENGQQLSFVDGWTFQTDAFLVTIGQVRLRAPSEGGDGEVVSRWDGPAIVDLASEQDGEVELGVIEAAPAARLDFGFDVVAASPGAQVRSAADADVEAMRANGWSMLVRGVATPTDANDTYTEPVEVYLGAGPEVTYYDCVNGQDGTKGISVAANTTSSAYIYPHLVHLFWDTLGAGNEDMRFDPFAAAAGDDGRVTLEDLESQDLTTLLDDDGVPLYDDAGLIEEYNLRAYVERAMVESPHFNGIGFCKKSLGAP